MFRNALRDFLCARKRQRNAFFGELCPESRDSLIADSRNV